VDRLCKILCFFNLVLKYFFSDLVLIEDQLILISYKGEIERRGTKIKKKPNTGDMS
jgi:hypothetical protein